MPEPGSPLVLELMLAVLMGVVFFAGVFARGADRRRVGVISAVGLVVLFGLAGRMEPGGALFGGSFVQDELAIFAKRLFLLATLIGVLGSLALRAPTFARRATEYHLAILASLLGMLVLASARDLILLFVAFELMSIPLYELAGFLKREAEAVEAALKFFLVGTVSSAVIVYGLSFVYGVTGTTDLRGIARALQSGHPLMMLGMVLALAGLGFKIAAFPFHMWVPDTYEAASTPFVAWLSVAPKAAGFVVIFRLYLEGVGDRVVLRVPWRWAWPPSPSSPATSWPFPQQNVKRLLAYSGIAHIGYMLVGLAAVSANGVAMMLFYLVAYLFGNMGAFLVVEAVAQSEGSENLAAYRGLAQRSPVLALCDAALPAVARRHSIRRRASGPSSTCSGRRRNRACMRWCWSAPSSPWWRSSTTCSWPSACTSTRPRDGPSRRVAAPHPLHPHLRARRGRHGRVSEAVRHGRPPRRLRPVLAGRSSQETKKPAGQAGFFVGPTSRWR